jgi:UDP-glucose 4-epimerase
MRAIVTGGAGFIGSNLVDALLHRGDEVSVVDNLSTGRRSNLEPALAAGATLHEVDVLDAERLAAIVEAQRPDAVFHLAAQIDVRRSVAETAFDARVNVEGTVGVLEAARRAGTPRFVFASTGGAIYGETDRLPTPEDEPPRPKAPYGQAKYAAEGYCELYARLHGMSTISLRYGNVYGPRQDPLGEAGVVAIFCGRLLAGRRPTVYGDGRQTRDYVHVDDVVAANLRAAESQATGPVNVGSGAEASVLDLVDALREIGAGADGFDPEFAPPRPGEVQRSCLDPGRAADVLPWAATVGLSEGLRGTLDSVRDG